VTGTTIPTPSMTDVTSTIMRVRWEAGRDVGRQDACDAPTDTPVRAQSYPLAGRSFDQQSVYSGLSLRVAP